MNHPGIEAALLAGDVPAAAMLAAAIPAPGEYLRQMCLIFYVYQLQQTQQENDHGKSSEAA